MTADAPRRARGLPEGDGMLSERRQRILRALIEEYVERALPVGSRTLTERYRLGVSSATVRNDLSALEDAGYIAQPHTSAGRIPTDAGYRAFVDDLFSTGAVAEEGPYREVVEQLRASASELDGLLEHTSAALARLTDCLSIVAAPLVLSAHIRQISLISLSAHQALVVVVTEDGQVVNRSMSFAEEVEPEQLAAVQGLIMKVFVGRAPAEVREALDQATLEELASPLARLVIDEVLTCLEENNMASMHRLGLSALMRKPEFSDASSLAPVMDALEDERMLLHVLDDADDSDELLVRIGRENGADELQRVSVVAAKYGRGDAEGLVCVVGPTRMDYPRVIQAVRAAQAALRDE